VEDFATAPMMFYYEVTQACDLVCLHCRASAQENADPEELTTEQACALIDQVASFPKQPHLVLTGGDPLKRPDLFTLIRHAVSLGLRVALTPSATPLATREAFQSAKEAGIQALGISLDGPNAETHDAFRGWSGSFDRTLEMLENARQLELPVQVNTTITRRNFQMIEPMAELLSCYGIAMWSVFFLIPVGRGVQEQRIDPGDYETVFAELWSQSQRQPFGIKTTEAPHYRRFVLEQTRESFTAGSAPANWLGSARHRAPPGVGDGKGIMFVSHRGEIYPAGFLPLLCGRFPDNSVVDIYQNHPTFRSLRDPDHFKGACGICEYRYVCGGSRSRAYAVTGDALETEPDCVYEPGQIPVVLVS
jgi:radical SAM protein